MDINDSFHNLLWPDPNKKTPIGHHWMRNSLMATWKKFQPRISPNLSPLKKPLENLRVYFCQNSLANITYKDLVKSPTDVKTEQDLYSEGYIVD